MPAWGEGGVRNGLGYRKTETEGHACICAYVSCTMEGLQKVSKQRAQVLEAGMQEKWVWVSGSRDGCKRRRTGTQALVGWVGRVAEDGVWVAALSVMPGSRDLEGVDGKKATQGKRSFFSFFLSLLFFFCGGGGGDGSGGDVVRVGGSGSGSGRGGVGVGGDDDNNKQ